MTWHNENLENVQHLILLRLDNAISTAVLVLVVVVACNAELEAPPFPAEPHEVVHPDAGGCECGADGVHLPAGDCHDEEEERGGHEAERDGAGEARGHAVGARHVGPLDAERDEGGELEEHAEAVEEVGGGDDAVEAEEGHGHGDGAAGQHAEPGGVEDRGAHREGAREEAQVCHAQKLERRAAQRGGVEADGRQHRAHLDPVLEPRPGDAACMRRRYFLLENRG
jgi:hypothetical protein